MKRTIKLLAWIGTAALIFSGSTFARPLNIVATTPELGSLASAIAGERAAVRSITAGQEDPHFLNARPTYMVMARNADLWIRMGLDLEIGWEPVIIDGSRNRSIRVGQRGHFDAANYVPYVLEVPDATVTRAMGDVHPSGNPHYMIDPYCARAVAIALAERLIDLDPAHAETYRAGLKDFLARLDREMFGAGLVERLGGERLWAAEAEGRFWELLEAEEALDDLGGWRGAMRSWKGKPIITFHKSWSYFAGRFDLTVAGELEPLPGIPPSPAHLARVIDLVRAREISLILKEPFYPLRPAEFVARETGARVATANTFATDVAADAYFRLMDSIVAAFAE